MKKLTWKQKLLGLCLFLACGIAPNDDPPQSRWDANDVAAVCVADAGQMKCCHKP